MFRIHEIIDSRRGAKKRVPPSEIELFDERADERTLPYFSIVPEQVTTDKRYLSLNQRHQSLYWLFVVHTLWKDGGRCIRHSGAIAKRMGVSITEWDELERLLLECCLLQVSPDGFHLVQPELRTQYLMTLATNNNKQHKKAD